MPFNGSGTYAAPASSWNPAVANTDIDVTDWIALLADLTTALSTCITKDGQTTTTGTIPIAGNLTVGGSVVVTSTSTSAAANTGNGITASIGSGVATTIFDVAARGRYDCYAVLNNAGSTAYTAFATVVSEGTTYRIVANNGANLTLTLSGSSVQVTQTSGVNQAINFAYLKIA